MPDNPHDMKEMVKDALFGKNGSVSLSQFTKAIDAVVKHLLRFEKKLEEKQSDAIDSIKRMSENFIKGADGKDSTVQGPRGLPGLQGERSYVPGPKGEPGNEGSPDTGEEVIDKINADKTMLIKMNKIEGMDEIEKGIRVNRANTNEMMAFSGSTVLTADISDQLDGVLKTFTLPSNARVLLVLSSSTPNIMRPTVDYTATASAITFTAEISASTTLATGQSVIILYKLP